MSSDGFDWLCCKCCLSELPFADVFSSYGDESAGNSVVADGGEGNECEVTKHGLVEDMFSDIGMNSKPNGSNKYLKVALVNVRSLLSCLDDVWHSITGQSIDLLGLNETWLDNSVAQGSCQKKKIRDHFARSAKFFCT